MFISWSTLLFIFEVLLNILGVILPVLIAVAYLTLFERKVMAGMQQRRGPVLVGFYGLLQPLADGLKLFLKETIFPTTANTIIFILAPVLTFLLSLIAWGVIPFSLGAVLSDINVGVLYLIAVSGIGVYGIITAG
jgi:NADH-quinone oxidoreductase subunit H